MMYDDLKQEILEISRLSYDRGYVAATNGNISACTPDGRGVLIKASGTSFAHLTMEDILLVDKEGRILEGSPGKKPSMELYLHLAVYAARPEMKAVVHLHPPHTTALSYLHREVPLLVLEAKMVLKKVPSVPSIPAGTPELVEAVSQAYMDEDVIAVVLKEHGIVTVAENLKEAFYRADLLEHNAQVACLVASMGGAVSL
ncbi:MAG: class II aldolase/adducin family protein [Synergistaceae bacterium]|nr:class II aldolase/adducin family protein [Synergistaceae bacterium]